jgi:formylglycine-generating enzyme required for sulfatase activity
MRFAIFAAAVLVICLDTSSRVLSGEATAERAQPASTCEHAGPALESSRQPQLLSIAEECALKPKDVFRECDKCPEMVVVPSGSFSMGSPESDAQRYPDESPQHTVTIARPFAVGKFHVTVDEFAAFVMDTGYNKGSDCWGFDGKWYTQKRSVSWRDPGFPQAGTHPAVCLDWYDAKSYVDWLARKTGKPYRLLTEAEWEYAARARTEPRPYTRYFFGDDPKDLCSYGDVADRTAQSTVRGFEKFPVAPCSDGRAYTAPVGSFAPNDFGLYDMIGNAFQWTEDCYRSGYDRAPVDGSAWTSRNCSRRVNRGGAWSSFPRTARTATRGQTPVDDQYEAIGLRVARTLSP